MAKRSKELLFRVPDRPGMLADVAAALAAKGINLRAVNGWVEGDEGVIRLVAEPHGAARVLLAEGGLDVEEREVIELQLADEPGALAGAGAKLGAAGVSITHVFLGTGAAGKATVFLGVTDLAAAEKALG